MLVLLVRALPPTPVSSIWMSSAGPNVVCRSECRLPVRMSSPGPNVVCRSECRLPVRMSSAGPNVVSRSECCLSVRMSSAGPNVVCRLVADFCAYIATNMPKERHVITANEGSAIALAAGYHMATGRCATVYMQVGGQ